MPEYELESIDIERYQISKHDNRVKCVCCGDSLIEDKEEFIFVSTDVYCIPCVYDADLRGYMYG